MMQTAINEKTGQTAVLVGDQWKIAEQVAVNPNGQRAYLVGGKWMSDSAVPQAPAAAPMTPAETRRKAGEMALEGMSGPEKIAAGVGQSLYSTGRGIGQLFGLVSGQDAGEASQRDSALLNSGAGMAGSAVGHAGQLLLPAAAALKVARLAPAAAAVLAPKTYLGAAAVGAGYGALQPGEGNSASDVLVDRAKNAALGGAGGAGGLLAGRAIGATVNAGRALVEPFTAGGRDKIVGRTLERFATDPARVTGATSTQIVPGSAPTLAEATVDPGIAQLTRSLVNESPQFAGQLAEHQVAQNAARLQVLRNLSGAPGAIPAAEQARKVATAPLYAQIEQSTAVVDPTRTVGLIDRIVKANPARKQLTGTLNEVRESLFEQYPAEQRGKDAWAVVNDAIGKRMSSADDTSIRSARTVMDRVRKGAIDADEALAQLKDIKATSKTARDAIAAAAEHMKTPEWVLRQEPQAIKSAIQNIGDIIERKGPDGAKVNEAIVRELVAVKKSLEHQMAKVEPAFRQAQSTFAQMSRPIDQMRIGEELLEHGTSALPKSGGDPKIYGEQLARKIRGDDALVRSATGFKRNKGLANVLEPQQFANLQALVDDLARSAAAQEAGRAVGSNTAQNLVGSNLLRQTLGPLGAPRSFAESALMGSLLRPVNFAARYPEQLVQRRLGEALLDPSQASAIVARVMPTASQAQRAALVDALVRGTSVALPTSALATRSNAAQ